jgi:hypothetical protein
MFKLMHILIYYSVIVYTLYITVVWGDFVTPILLIFIVPYLLNKKNSIKESNNEKAFLEYEKNYLIRTKLLR